MADGANRDVEDSQVNADSNTDENNVDSDGEFSDPEGFVDEVDDEDLLGDVLKQEPKETDGVESIIVVDGVPHVGAERLEKLQNVIRKIFAKFGKIIHEFYPKDEKEQTKGYIFLEYSSPDNALEAVKMTNGYKLDKQHTFSVNLFTDFDKYDNVPKQWTAPQAKPYKNLGNLRSWLLNADCNDQYSVITEGGNKTSIWWNSMPEPSLIEERTCWTETYVQWSPLGTYFATIHYQGIALWGGEDFHQIMKFGHTAVQFIDFSPNEKYLITFSPIPDNREDAQCAIIWDIRTGTRKRKFQCDSHSVWPIFKWTHNDKYFGRLGQDMISIYETPSFGLLDKKSIKVPGIRDFCWSPSDQILSYWVAEDKDVPARVSLIEIPSRKELRSNNLFNVADCKMHWQKSGNYLCVKVDRYSKYLKSKKEKSDKAEVKYSGMYTKFEVFHIKEKNIPVDSIEIKDNITAFAWEPVGHKFAIIHGETPNICVSFYSTKGGINLIKKCERRQCNHLFWSPNGQFIVLAGLRNMSGTLEFVDTVDMTFMATSEHFMATDVEWDPSGRYIMTSVSYWGYKFDNGYWIWSFQGRLLQKHLADRFCQFLWRPRPSSLITPQQLKDIKKNIKKYSAQFEMRDRMQLTKASKELIDKRKKLMDDYRNYRNERIAQFESMKSERLQLRDNIATDELDSNKEDLEEETFEFFIKEEEIVIGE